MASVGSSDLYTLYDFLDDRDHAALGARRIYTSALNNLPFVEKYYRWTFPFCPQAMEAFDLSQYDLVISLAPAIGSRTAGTLRRERRRFIAATSSN
jgi:hypothetical protein